MYQVGYFLTRNATMFPDRVAVISNDRQLTYAELNRAANRLANNLSKLGIKKGDRLAFLLPNSIEIIILWHATQKIGATALPINLRYHASEIVGILKDSASRILVHGTRLLEMVRDEVLPECPGIEQVFYVSTDGRAGLGRELSPLIESGDEREPWVDLSGDDESVILYTSGTSGNPKGVMHTQQMVKEFSYMLALEACPANEPQTVLVFSPIYHLGGIQHIWRTISLCGTLVLLRKMYAEDVLEYIEKYHVTEFFLLPPILIKRLYDCPDKNEYDLSSVKTVMCAGGKCSRDISRMIFEMFPNCKIRLSYGSTETFCPTTSYVTKEMIAERPELATSIGKINAQNEIRLVDAKNNDVQDGEPGEALVRSPMLFRGYLNLPEKNKKVLEQDGWFHTEDVMKRSSDGYYFVVDRIKDMIKSGGENVYAQEVESILRDFPDIVDCAVIGLPDPEMEEGVAAAIVTRDGNPLDAQTFLDECRANMASYKKPRYWAFMKELPTNSIGKIQKSVLREHPEWFERIG